MTVEPVPPPARRHRRSLSTDAAHSALKQQPPAASFGDQREPQDDGDAAYASSNGRRRWGRRRPLHESHQTLSGSFLSRELFLKRYFGDTAFTVGHGSNRSKLFSTTFLSNNGSESSAATSAGTDDSTPTYSIPVPINKAAAEELTGQLTGSAPYRRGTKINDEALIDCARRAKRRIEGMAKREAIVGNWRLRREIGLNECQVLDLKSKERDEYSVIAKMNMLCSLRELMQVLSTDSMSEFHRSMVALFGDQYVYGVNLRTMDLSGRPSTRASSALNPAILGKARASASRSRLSISGFSNTKLAVNAVTLLLRHHVLWRQQGLCFLDYLDEKMDALTATRVLHTIDVPDGDEPSTDSEGETIKNLLAGYVVREDPIEKFTRVFFYATTKSLDPRAPVSLTARHLLRCMAETVCLLERIVVRRRLGALRLSLLSSAPPSSSSSNIPMETCSVCASAFTSLRRPHICVCCGAATCRRCLSAHEIEEQLGMVSRGRVCRGCMRNSTFAMMSNLSLLELNSTWSRAPVSLPNIDELGFDGLRLSDSPPLLDAEQDEEEQEEPGAEFRITSPPHPTFGWHFRSSHGPSRLPPGSTTSSHTIRFDSFHARAPRVPQSPEIDGVRPRTPRESITILSLTYSLGHFHSPTQISKTKSNCGNPTKPSDLAFKVIAKSALEGWSG